MAADEPAVVVEPIGAVRRLTLNRPDRHNPLTARCIRELLAAVADADRDPAVRVVVIRGSGRSFSSGYGVLPEDIEPGEADRAGRDRGRRHVHDRAGHPVGPGSGTAPSRSSPRYTAIAWPAGPTSPSTATSWWPPTDARIGFPPVRSMGVPPTNMWLYHLGPQWTKRLLFTGDTVSGAEAASARPGPGGGARPRARRATPWPWRGASRWSAATCSRPTSGWSTKGSSSWAAPSSSASPPSTTPWPTGPLTPGPSPPGPAEVGLKQAVRDRDRHFEAEAHPGDRP